VQAISSVVATSILSGRASQMKMEKSGILQSDIVVLPFNSPNHWVIVITRMETKELVIIDPLGNEMTYEREFLRDWRSFLYQQTAKLSGNWKTKIVEHKRQSDGHNCGPLILKRVWRTTAYTAI
ncbi:unnamed protein product, partial [Natator depressus]